MPKIGYARVSSSDQKLDRQLDLLKSCEKIFCDKLSGTTNKLPELQKMLKYIWEDDIVVVSELDRLGRNNKDLIEGMTGINAKTFRRYLGRMNLRYIENYDKIPKETVDGGTSALLC